MNRLKKIALLTFTLLFSLSAWSQDFEREGLRFLLLGGSASVSGRVAASRETDINIPASVNYEGVDYPVTAIGEEAFRGNNVTSVTIPDSVITIGDRAFRSNPFTSVTIPDSVITIGDEAFSFSHLTSVTIPDSVITIGDQAFYWSDTLAEATIGNSVTTIGYGAFAKNNLTSITIPESVKKIGFGAFIGNSLTSVTIPASVTTIEFAAFVGVQTIDENAATLTSITFQGAYTEWVPDPENPYTGSGISPNIFSYVSSTGYVTKSPLLSSISACPSASWDNVTFEIAVGVLQPLGVTQDPAACPFVDPVVLIDELSAFVADLNAKNGILNALDAKLGAVQGALSDLNENNDVAALNAMYAFCYNAQAQSGKQLETADADALIAKADAIIAAIDPDAALCSE